MTDRSEHPRHVLTLYVFGTTPLSSRAIVNMRAICEDAVPGDYKLTIVDIARDGATAREKQIVATPTLIRELPLPQKRLMGDFSAREVVLVKLDLPLRHEGGGT